MRFIDFWVPRLASNPALKETIDAVKWKNVHKDQLPEDGQEVLLESEGVYYCTTYDAAAQVFRLRDAPHSFFAVADRSTYHWIEIDSPKAVIKPEEIR